MLERQQNNQATRRGDAYGRGIALQVQMQQETSGNRAAVVNAQSQVWATSTKCCCGATDHVKVSFGGCRLNKKNLAKQNDAVEHTTMDMAMTE